MGGVEAHRSLCRAALAGFGGVVAHAVRGNQYRTLDEEHIVETGREAVLRTLVVECHAVVSGFGVMYIFAIITVR